jgi:hypothetical protein
MGVFLDQVFAIPSCQDGAPIGDTLQITQIFLRKVVRLHFKHGLVNDVGIAISRAL